MGKRSENYCLRIKTAGILYLAGAQACKKKLSAGKVETIKWTSVKNQIS